ncbi:hypothetical protein [Azospirillum sp. A39]|uniref:hypothetical protein n=1 Tax=Azospirillum sp. A39 TaxID=3462279 RepID=UPI004045FA46
MTGRIAQALFGAFGLPAPAVPPAPAPADRFPVFGRPPPPTPWHPERLALAGAVTLASRR